MSFKEDFIWGAATSSYQIEGSTVSDGKGLSIWDTCSKIPGFVRGNQTGEIACDHYNRYLEDVRIMKEMGLKAYRFSISWSRILPKGIGELNEQGILFYDNLVNELIQNGITPYVTLFHWDYPEELMKLGGWMNGESSDWFAEYAKVVVDRLSDRVDHWLTLNEPQCFVKLGYEDGIHAPGIKAGRRYVFAVAHNMLLAHGKAVKVIREHAKKPPHIGFAPALNYVIPDNDNAINMEAAKNKMFSCQREDGIWCTSWWTESIYNGRYPEDGLIAFKEWLPDFKEGDMEIIGQKLDFFGFNYYHGQRLTNNSIPGEAETAVEWPLVPEGIYYMTKFLYEKYHLPILITENGMANLDWPCLDGSIHDYQRIDYIERHLKELKRAVEDGIAILGYMYWSLMDNYEWQNGYSKRFGLIYIDYLTQKRIWKDSAYWYQKVISDNGRGI